MCINSEIFLSPEKNFSRKNQECSESSEMPRKVVLRHFKKMHNMHILCIIMHILNFLGFF